MLVKRDLRLSDNTALYQALKGNYPVLPVFIFDRNILDKLSEKKDRRVVFIHQALEQINVELMENGSSLYVLHDNPTGAFKTIFDEFNIKGVYANHDYEPYAIERDTAIKNFLSDKNISFHTYKDQVIFERSEIMKSDGTPYTDFYSLFKGMETKIC